MNLTLATCARHPSESVRPDLWPDHAWVPALGVQGGVLYDLAGNSHAALSAGDAYTTTNQGVALVGDLAAKRAIMAFDNYPTYPCTLFSAGQVLDTDPQYESVWGVGGSETNSYIITALNGRRPIIVARNIAYRQSGVLPQLLRGTPYTLTGTFHSRFLRRLYVNGSFAIQDTINPGDTWPEVVTQGSIHGLPDPGSSNRYEGLIAVAYIFKRILSDPQIQELSTDPLLPFRRRENLPLYFFTGGGTSISALFDLRSRVSNQYVFAADQRAAISNLQSRAADTEVAVSNSRTVLHDLQAKIANALISEVDTRAAISNSIESNADTQVTVGTEQSVEISFDTLASISRAVDRATDTGASISRSLAATADTRVIVTMDNTVTVSFDTLAQISREASLVADTHVAISRGLVTVVDTSASIRNQIVTEVDTVAVVSAHTVILIPFDTLVQVSREEGFAADTRVYIMTASGWAELIVNPNIINVSPVRNISNATTKRSITKGAS